MRTTVVLTFTLLVASTLWATDTFDGVWKFNQAKSDFGSGPRWQDRTITIGHQGETRSDSVEIVYVDGATYSAKSETKYDGKYYPIVGNPGLSISMKRTGSHTAEYSYKNGDKVTQESRSIISSDGKTMTTTMKGTTVDGKPFTAVYVYNKQ